MVKWNKAFSAAKKLIGRADSSYNKIKPYYEKYSPYVGKAYQKIRPFLGAKGMAIDVAMSFAGSRSRIFGKEISSVSGTITKSRYKVGKKDQSYYKKAFKDAQEYELLSDIGFQISSDIGSQRITCLNYISNADLFNIAGVLTTQLVANTTRANNSQKFGVCKSRVTTTFSNSGNNNLILELSEVSMRRDIPIVKGYTPPTTASIYPPDQCMSNTWVNQRASQGDGASGATYNQFTNESYGVTPFDNQMFNFYYKVDRVQKITLAPGSSHEHNSEYYVNAALSVGAFKNTAPGCDYGGFRGIYRGLMVRQYGLPVHDSENTTDVSIGPTRVDATINQVITYHDFVGSNVITLRAGTVFDDVTNPEQVVVNNPTDTASVNEG